MRGATVCSNVCSIVAAGGTVVAAGAVVGAHFLHGLYAGAADAHNGTLGYGQRAETPGLHTMHASTNNIAEVGATGDPGGGLC